MMEENLAPVFSIIVPVYKTAKYLPKCIDSILSQTFKNFELILVDDGSPDDCPQICDDYAEKDFRIKVIHKKNGGVSSARNCGIDAAKGTYIWFIDSDDYIEPFSLQRLFEVQKNHNAELYVFNNRSVCELSTENINEFFRKYHFTYVLGFEPWNKLFKREIIKANNLQFDTQETIGEDLLFNLNYYKTIFSDGAKDIYFIGEDYYHIVRRNDSAMSTASKGRIYRQLQLFDKIYNSLSGMLSEDNISYLFIMHLFLGSIPSDELTSKEFAEIDFSNYQSQIKKSKKIQSLFCQNEASSKSGKIRINLFLFLMRRKMYRIAGKIRGLK